MENYFRIYHPDEGLQKSRSKIKIYDKNDMNKIESKKKKIEIAEILNRNRKEIHNINEIIIEDDFDKNVDLEKEIEEFFKQNEPKSKGWLLRKKESKKEKLTNLFFILEKEELKLISIKPTKIKVYTSFINYYEQKYLIIRKNLKSIKY